MGSVYPNPFFEAKVHMFKILKKVIFVSAFALLLSGCGKNELKTGEMVSDPSILSEGVFTETIIDTSVLPDKIANVSSYACSDGYSYLLECFDTESYSSVYYLIRFDLSGNVSTFKSLDIPFSVVDSSYSDSDSLLNDFYSVNYQGLNFDENGSVYGYTLLSASTSEYDADSDLFNRGLKVCWDQNGECLSVSAVDEDVFSFIPSTESKFSGLNGVFYEITNSGISILNPDFSYSSKYFDFLNSCVDGSYFREASVVNDECFSGLYINYDGNYVLSCFNRKADSSTDSKAIILACDKLDSYLKRDVFDFNKQNNNFKIAVIDYSDRSASGESAEGWSLLKEDIVNGFRPDLVVYSTGYDQQFVSYLGNQNLVSDLTSVISNNFDKDEKHFNDKAESLFYSDKNVYAFVPSYYYRTIIGSSDLLGADDQLGLEDFVSVLMPLADNREVFLNDSREAFLKRALAYCGNRLVDYSNRSSNFNSSDFITYLEYAGKIPAELNEYRNADIPGYVYGDAFLFDREWDNIGDIQLTSTRFCAGDYSDFGFPFSESEGSGVVSATRSFMILSTNAYTNECWDFIKKYLSDDYQNSLTDEIPVTEEAYNIWISNIGFYVSDDSSLNYYKDGMVYTVSIPDEDRINYIVNSINSCNTFVFSDYRVEQIVLENAQKYFDGSVSAEDATKMIDTEVQAYLNS